MTQATTTSTTERKHSHVDICLNGDVAFSRKTTGLERCSFVPDALPEIRLADIELSTTFLGRRIGAPLMVSSMTGGYSEAGELNRRLAETAERYAIPLGVGSMRQALEESSHRDSFAVVRRHAPSIQIFANIGAPEVARGLSDAELDLLIDLIAADGLIVHLNAAQELFQPEGSTDFRRVLDEIARLCAKLPVPVIAKEVGCGIVAPAARELLRAGVRVIDVAGAGGLSWQKVEEVRYVRRFGADTRYSPDALEELLEWGTPTAECVAGAAALRQKQPELGEFEIIASGGIKSGMDIAKSIALGAGIAASAGALLKALHANRLEETIETWLNDLRAVMFLTGSATIGELSTRPLTLNP